MPSTRSESSALTLGPENEWVEYKASTSELRAGVASLAAMLNKHRTATLYFGVTDEGEVKGQLTSKATAKDVRSAITDLVRPQVDPVIEVIPIGDGGRSFIKVSAEGTERPYSCRGVFRIRDGEEDVLMSPEEIEAMTVERFFSRIPWDTHASGRLPSEVDEAALRSYVERGAENRRIPFTYTTAQDAIERLGLLADDATQLNNAAAVMFCHSEQDRLRMATFSERSRTEGFSLRSSGAPLLELVDEAAYYIDSQVPRRSVYDEGFVRRDIPRIPAEVIREALLNAFAHRDWVVPGACVLVDIYPHEVAIENPGWFLPHQDPEDHLLGRNRSSNSRNQFLSTLLFRSGEVERSGFGLPRMKRLCDEAGISIVYERGRESTRLRLLFDDEPQTTREDHASELPRAKRRGRAKDCLRRS